MKKPILKKTNLFRVAINYLSFRPRFENEVRTKLLSKTDDLTLINQIIEELKQNRFLDDKSLVESLVTRLLKEKSKGPIFINHKLKRLGVSADLINQTLSKIATKDNQKRAIRKIIDKHFKNKNQIIRLLGSRGFSWDQISPFIDEIKQIE
jgi:regulatory protein